MSDREEGWAFRVKVSDKQAVIGFAKHLTIGVGFAVEEDENTNVPFVTKVLDIFDYIKINKGDDHIPDERCIQAIRMVKTAAKKWMDFIKKDDDEKMMKMFPELRAADGKLMTYTQFRKACRVAQQAYGGGYNVVFGAADDGTFKRMFTTNNTGDGMKSAMERLYDFLRHCALRPDNIHGARRHFDIIGADFAYNKGALPNKWTSGLIGIDNFVAEPA